MSISTPTDIVLDVARAADPQRLQAATRKLARQTVVAGESDFAALVDKTGNPPARPASMKLDQTALVARASAKPARASAAVAPTEAAYQALGGILLQKTFESAMPDKSTSLFGKGTAGAMWKSMLAQHLTSGVSASIFKLPKIGAKHANDDTSISQPVAAPAAALT